MRMEIVVALEHRAHAIDRPAFDLAAELLADQPDRRDVGFGVVGLRHLEPAALDQIDARHAGIADGRRAHSRGPTSDSAHSALALIEADALDDLLHVAGEAWQHEAGVAARRVPGDAATLQHHHRPAAARQLARRGEAGEAGADHADVDVDIGGQRPALGRGHHRFGVPARRIGRPFGRSHGGIVPEQDQRPTLADPMNWPWSRLPPPANNA